MIKALLKKTLVSSEIENKFSKMSKSTGSFGYDPWGYNMDTMKIGYAIFKNIYDHYFRVEARGLENIPARGRVLIIGNHSGQIPFDGALVGIALASSEHSPRAARAMIERFFPTVPFIGNILNQFGATIGDPINCNKMLQAEEAVIVFPEGVRGSGKLYNQRYQLQRFGNGFMHLAMENSTPIVPVGIVGCEETMPSLANIKPLARLLGLPYVPLTTPLPLPAKVILNFGEPMHFKSARTDTEESVTQRVEQVKNELRHLIQKGLSERKGVF